jgi:prephenate dehydrogenase
LASRVGAEYCDSNVAAALERNIVVLAIPISAFADVMEEIIPVLGKNTLLIEISAVKSKVIPFLRRAEKRGVKIASVHPMFGPRASSLSHKRILIVRVGSSDAVSEVKRLFKGADFVLVNRAVHDKQTAVTLALPHFLNMAFAESICKRKMKTVRKFTGRTFDLQMLLAETIADEPETAAEIQTTNREFKPVLRKLQRAIQDLTKIALRRDRVRLIRRYKRIRRSLSADPEFEAARRAFEQISENSTTRTRTYRKGAAGSREP